MSLQLHWCSGAGKNGMENMEAIAKWLWGGGSGNTGAGG
jgi:hypothetical protein